MNNKRFDWMTPEEAARELEPGEIVWTYNGKVQPGILELFSDDVPRISYYGYYYPLACFEKICRAIVPEVPSE